jgi:hypothetical protein
MACLKVGIFRPKHVDIYCMADTIINNCTNDNFVSTYRHFYDQKNPSMAQDWRKHIHSIQNI